MLNIYLITHSDLVNSLFKVLTPKHTVEMQLN